ncbi:RPAP1-like protein [Coniella lustricola]|uniref:RPAP1-like protein n=1 Tax=Coniella lustricola TaxID=2025994 RepID=A0A2T3A1E4_9PEZI|nr:RPAP1-like protein [Coniella lustricola]
MDFIADIKEKEVGTIKAPSFPQPKPATDGFPQHKKRTRVSAFKQKRQEANGFSPAANADPPQQNATSRAPPSSARATPGPTRPAVSDEKTRIDKENNDLLASMSPQQIEEERRELLERLDPSIIQMLLKRATIDDRQPTPSIFDEPAEAKMEDSPPSTEEAPQAAPVAPATHEPESIKPRKTVCFDEDSVPPEPSSSDLFEATTQQPPTSSNNNNNNNNNTIDTLAPNTTHFPQPQQIPDLDPADPDFLDNLHKKYFPSLPADPSKLAWMAPIPTPHSTADRESPYYPGQTSLPISALRFDFKGRLLSPAKSRSIPTSKGLHHHGEAPEAAGYTVAELGRLARSAVPAQRCVAFQTLGRILFRLGKGEWGAGSGAGSSASPEQPEEEADVATGIWASVKENRVIDSLLEAAEVPEGHGHRGSRAYALEALWLFEKGGWKEKFKGR